MVSMAKARCIQNILRADDFVRSVLEMSQSLTDVLLKETVGRCIILQSVLYSRGVLQREVRGSK